MFFIIALLAIMGLIGTDLFAPSLPDIAINFQQTANHTQLTISLFLAGFAFSQLFYGPLSDKIGRKIPLIIGTSIFISGSLLCSVTHSFTILCLGRIIQGLGVGGGLSLSRVVLRDLYHGTELAVQSSHMALFVALTPAVAPFVGGLLQQFYGFRASFIFMLLYGIVVLLLLCTIFKETNIEKDQSLTLKYTVIHYYAILKNHFFMIYVITAGIAFSSIILCANILPFIIQNQLHMTALQNGEILLIAALGLWGGALISKKTVRHFGAEQMVFFGLIILAFGGLLLILSNEVWGTHLVILIPVIFMSMIAGGFIFPNALAVAFSHVHIKIGIAGSIYGSIQILISMLVNLLLNMITHQDQSLLGLFYLALGIIGWMLLPKKKVMR